MDIRALVMGKQNPMEKLGVEGQTERSPLGQALADLRRLREVAANAGFRIPEAHPSSAQMFNDMPLDRQRLFAETLRASIDPLLEQMNQFIEHGVIPAEVEHRCLKKAGQRLGWRLDESIGTELREGDIVEVYNLDSLQVYRNFQFFQHSNYNLLDIITHPWTHLWERPKRIVETSQRRMAEVMALPSGRPIEADMPTYLLRENAFDVHQVFEMRFRFFAKVMTENGAPCGLLAVARCRLVAEGADAKNIRFL